MLNQNLKDYLLDIDNLRSITRFQTAPRNAKETVAEHSFYVAAIVLKLHDYFDFNLEQALVTALMHDYAEVYISDVPHSIKVSNPKISIELEAAETKINTDKLSTEIAQNIADFNNCATAEGCMVALADTLSVLMYSRYEVKLGNKEYMREVYHKTFRRVTAVLTKASKYFKKNVTMIDMINLIDDFSQSKIKDN